MFCIWKAVKVDIAQLRSEYISLLFTFDYSIAWDKAEERKQYFPFAREIIGKDRYPFQ